MMPVFIRRENTVKVIQLATYETIFYRPLEIDRYQFMKKNISVNYALEIFARARGRTMYAKSSANAGVVCDQLGDVA